MNIVTLKIEGVEVTRMLDAKSFADKPEIVKGKPTGKVLTHRKGFGSYGRVEMNGHIYQLSLNMIQLDAKEYAKK